MRREPIMRVAVFAAAALAAALLFPALPLKAQQSGGPADTAKQVPDNPAAHEAPAQPIPYSHQTHLALGLECAMCHTNPEPGNLMTFPATSICMSCHTTVATNKPSIQNLPHSQSRASPFHGCACTLSRKGSTGRTANIWTRE